MAVGGKTIVYAALHVAAWLSATFVGWTLRERVFNAAQRPIEGSRLAYYLLSIWVGAMAGAYGLGTLNLALDGIAGVGRSIIGAIFGGVIAAELFKAAFGNQRVYRRDVRRAAGVGHRRRTIGLLLRWASGLHLWHPDRCFCGASISATACTAILCSFTNRWRCSSFSLISRRALRHRRDAAIRWGFYVFVAWYAVQRFVWEFLKPYPAVAGPFNVFHLRLPGADRPTQLMIGRNRECHRHARA